MESLSTEAKKPASLRQPPPMDPSPSPSKAESFIQIATPEKPIPMPRRAKNSGVIFSMEKVKKIAMGLRTPPKGRSRSDDELAALDEQLASDSASNPARMLSKSRSPIKLPEKFEILSEFFNCLVISTRLLRLKGLMSTFSNICAAIQHLTDRRFTYGHLAQMKFILPEAISLKKVLLRDEVTCCMKPELHVALQTDVIRKNMKHNCEGGYSMLRKVFRARIENYYREHPEEDNIQEEALPYPFNQIKPSTPSDTIIFSKSSSPAKPSLTAVPQQQIAVASHMSRSFHRWFSQKTLILDAASAPLSSFNESSPADDAIVSSALSPVKSTSRQPPSEKALPVSPDSVSSLSTYQGHEEKSKDFMSINNCSREETKSLEGTPAKLISTPTRLMTITPEIQTPKRYRPTTIYGTPPQENFGKRSVRTELFPAPKQNEKMADSEDETRNLQDFNDDDDDDNDINFLPDTLLQSIRAKEMKVLEERQASLSNEKRRKKMMASLPKLFDIILLIFQSGNHIIITKQELFYKIIACYSSIVDIDEVEEQFKILLELAPDWISEKRIFGDIHYQKLLAMNQERVWRGPLPVFFSNDEDVIRTQVSGTTLKRLHQLS